MTDNSQGYDLGSAYGSVIIDTSTIASSMKTAQQVFSGHLKGFSDGFDKLAQKITDVGRTITALTAPATNALQGAVESSMKFSESMTNVQAVLGTTAKQTAKLSEEVLNIGKNSRAGPQAAAEAFYDIVGGVSDASSHMAILQAAMNTAEAGSASLGSTTKALISVMNSYKFSAKDAADVSDVLTETVAMGVGTMEDFAAAIPQVTGIAHSSGIELKAMAADLAYLTTQGNSASEASTQLSRVMVAFLNPTEQMKKAIKGLGYENGEAMIKALGLSGSLKKIKDSQYGKDFNVMLGSIEAFRAGISLTGDDVAAFEAKFDKASKGATDAAKKIQNQSLAAQLDKIKSSIAGLSIVIGNTLGPVLAKVTEFLQPIINMISDWVQANPEFVGTMTLVIASVSAFGVALLTLGPILTNLGGLIGLLVSGPVGLLLGAMGALLVAFETNFGGIRDLVMPIIERIKSAFKLLTDQFGQFVKNIQKFGLAKALAGALNLGDGKKYASGWIQGVIEALGVGSDTAASIVTTLNNMLQTTISLFEKAVNVISLFGGGIAATFQNLALGDDIWTSIINGMGDFIDNIGRALGFTDQFSIGMQHAFTAIVLVIRDFVTAAEEIWNRVRPSLEMLVGWFVNGALPQIVNIITTSVIPAVLKFIGFLLRLWDDTAPKLEQLFNWFTKQALPAILGFISNQFLPAIQKLIDALVKIWDDVSPKLEELYKWFIDDALPAIGQALEDFNTNFVEPTISILKDLWDLVKPYLQQLYDWFVTNALPAIKNALNTFNTQVVQPAIAWLKRIWDDVSPKLREFAQWFHTNLPVIQGIFNNTIGAMIGTIQSLIQNINNAINAFNALRGVQSTPTPQVSVTPQVGNGTFNAGTQSPQSVKQGVQTVTNFANSLVNQGKNFLASLGFRKAGGPVTKDSPVVVGEEHAEIFYPTQNGVVSPEAMGGDTYSIVNHIGSIGNDVTQAQIDEMMEKAVYRVVNKKRLGLR